MIPGVLDYSHLIYKSHPVTLSLALFSQENLAPPYPPYDPTDS